MKFNANMVQELFVKYRIYITYHKESILVLRMQNGYFISQR